MKACLRTWLIVTSDLTPPRHVRASRSKVSQVLPLGTTHEILVEDPRAQDKKQFLMSELVSRYVLSVERLLGKRRRPSHDQVAVSLQPCAARGTLDVQALLEAQGRRFTQNYVKSHGILGPTMR